MGHNLNSIPNMYSFHSWIGILTVILFSFQWLFGFVIFLFPGLKAQMRAAYLDVHVFFGLTIFVTACAAAFTGFTEKTIFGLSEFLIANFTGYAIFIFTALVIYLATNPRFKRLNMPMNEIKD